MAEKPVKATKSMDTNKEVLRHTTRIKILGIGANKNNDPYLKVSADNNIAILNVDALDQGREWRTLARVGAPLLTAAAKNEFRARAQEAVNNAAGKMSFQVATQIGFHGDAFVLPDGIMPRTANVELCLDSQFADYHRKFHCAGSLEGWQEIADLCRGNSRALLCLGLACSGPTCAAVGYEPPGVQLTGRGGGGKSTLGVMVTSLLGGDSDLKGPGFGVSWNSKMDKLEVVAAAFNNTILFLDDTSNAAADRLLAIMKIIEGQGKGRYTELYRLIWLTPLLSTSNASVVGILGTRAADQLEVYVDRLLDIPAPEGYDRFFEDLHGSANLVDFRTRVRKMVAANHGYAGRKFISWLVMQRAKDSKKLLAFVERRVAEYQIAANGIKAMERDLARACHRFGTIYASSCLAIEARILPFTRAEMLEAVLCCQRDHVAFIDRERGLGAAGALRQVSAWRPIQPANTPLQRLQHFVDENERRLIDLRLNKGVPSAIHPDEDAPGYIASYRGHKELWFTNERFEEIVGGKNNADSLKKRLLELEQIATEARDDGRGYVVKRNISGPGRQYVVALRPGKKSRPHPSKVEKPSSN